MMLDTETLARWASQDEGQFFERKSAFDRSRGGRRQRKAADLARDIVEGNLGMSVPSDPVSTKAESGSVLGGSPGAARRMPKTGAAGVYAVS